MEYYHLPWVHPELIKVSRMEDHYRYQGPGLYCGMTTSPVSPDTESGGWLALPPSPHVTAGDAISGRFIWIFPNVALSVLPNHVFMMLVTPDGPGHTVEQTFLFSHPASQGQPGFEPALDKLLGFWDLVNQQDIEIVEKVQQGLATSAAYTGGRMCYQFEEPVHRFQNMVIDRMVGVQRVPAGDDPDALPAFARPATLQAAA